MRIRTQAGSKPPPATIGCSSVFAMGQQAKAAKQRAPRTTIDINAITVQRGVPVPPPQSGAMAVSPYAALLARMSPGDMVELPYRQGYGLISMAKKLKINVTRRTLAGGMISIWRV
jgi:hypothetical protein